MKTAKKYSHWGIPASLASLLLIGLVAWTTSPIQQIADHIPQDTIPSKKRAARNLDTRDLDKELRKLEEAQEKLGNLQNKTWEDVQKHFDEARKHLDAEKIQLQVEQAMKAVDMEKIRQQVERSLRDIDFEKIQKDVERSVDAATKIDREEIQKELLKAKKEVQEQLSKQNWERIKIEMDQAKKVNQKEITEAIEKAKKEMSQAKIRLDLEKLDLKETMAKAHEGIAKAHKELRALQEMIYDMEADGLLNTKEDYSIEYKNGELFINDKKQPADILNKYKKYFGKDNVTIKKRNGDLKIDND